MLTKKLDTFKYVKQALENLLRETIPTSKKH